MLRNNLLTSYRYLKKHKGYTAINLFGLSIGLTCCLIIFYFLKHELSYDNFHSKRDVIYRINTDAPNGTGGFTKFVNSPPAVAPNIPDLFPEIEKATQLRYVLRSRFNKGDLSFYEDYGYYADSLFLEIFSYDLKVGNPGTALDDPNSIIMTEEMALKYFKDPNPVGELITMNNDLVLRVTGILDAVPSNSHLKFDFLVSFSTYEIPSGYLSDLTSWRWLGFLTYVELTPGTDPVGFEAKLNDLYTEKTPQRRTPAKARVQPLLDIYFGSTGMNDDLASHLRSGNRYTIYALAAIAILILLIAGFNFMNLTTAISVNRGKEVGLRKVLGADKSKIAMQLLTEAGLVSVASLILSIALFFACFPYLSSLLGWDFRIDFSLVLYAFPLLVVAAVLLGLFAGMYPSLLLARFHTIAALKGNLRLGKGVGIRLRNTLVVLQFSISIALIISTVVIVRQIQHMRSQSLGFDQENVITMKLLPADMTRYYDTFKDLISQNSQVINVSRSERLMGDPWPPNPALIEGQDRSEAKQVVGNLVGFDYLKTMGIKLKEGRSFSKEFAQDSLRSIIITEKTVSYLGLEDPIGKKLRFFSIDGPRTIIGVAEDFNYASLHKSISPIVLIMPFVDLEHMYVRVSPGNVSERVALINDTWNEVAPGVPLEIGFMDDHLYRLYQKEEKLSLMISAFSTLAVVLACLGLYGLVAFMVNNRMKEVGVRKVLGATIYSLMVLFSRQYLYLIFIALVISIPGSWYILNQWLDGFAYRTEIQWWIYAVAALILVAIAMITISQKTIKAALTNPVRALRDE